MGLALLASACSNPRIHRLTDVKYTPLEANAAVALSEEKIAERDYTPIAIVDSFRYAVSPDGPSPKQRERMMEELRVLARELGADAVHKVRTLPVRVRGFVGDENVPIENAWRPGYRDFNIMRGEAVIYMEETEQPAVSNKTKAMEISE